MNELVLFAGAGGGILGSRILGHRIVGAVEIDPYCREILLRRQEEGHLEPFPIFGDVRRFDGRPWRGAVDLVSAGFPCQPFSGSGKGLAGEDDRNLWPETIRVIREVGPRVAFLENVPNLLSHDYFGEILGDLAEAGFDAEWEVVSAAEVGAPHLRERLWILAFANGDGRNGRPVDETCLGRGSVGIEGQRTPCTASRTSVDDPDGQPRHERLHGQARLATQDLGREPEGARGERAVAADPRTAVADAARDRREHEQEEEGEGRDAHRRGPWELGDEPQEVGGRKAPSGVPLLAHGLAYSVDQLRASGNGQVPRVVVEAWSRLSESDY